MVTHLLAVDQVLYAAAAVETRLLASALRAQHDLIAARLAELLRAGVRAIPLARRPSQVFGASARLAPGESFILSQPNRSG